jgi:uncharacterized protein YodC (DUF2158 family)
MTEPQFKKGDVVKLASGGPKMTVTGEGAYGTGVACEWFDAKGNRQTGDFEPEALVKVPPTGAPQIVVRKIQRG